MALTIHTLDFGDIELENSFLVLGHNCGRTARVRRVVHGRQDGVSPGRE